MNYENDYPLLSPRRPQDADLSVTGHAGACVGVPGSEIHYEWRPNGRRFTGLGRIEDNHYYEL